MLRRFFVSSIVSHGPLYAMPVGKNPQTHDRRPHLANLVTGQRVPSLYLSANTPFSALIP